MNTVKYRGFRPATTRRGSVFFDDNIFRDFFNDTWKGGSMMPASNIKEDEKLFTIEMAAPGLEKSDFKINLDDDLLTISSERKEEKNEETEKYTRKEFQYSGFSRSWNLPETIDTEAISASYNNGILSVVLPKKQEAIKNFNKEIEIS